MPTFRRDSTLPLLLLSLGLALSTISVVLPPVVANNWYGTTGNGSPSSCSGGNRADANPHSVYFARYNSEIFYSVNVAMREIANETAVAPQVSSSQNSSTDIIVIGRHYDDYCGRDWAASGTSGGTFGLTTCNGANPSGRCGQHETRYNLNAMDDLGVAFDNWLVTHEQGHALGLKHRNSELGAMTGLSSGVYEFTSHDKAHVNGAAW